jgi:hypothetical protein
MRAGLHIQLEKQKKKESKQLLRPDQNSMNALLKCPNGDETGKAYRIHTESKVRFCTQISVCGWRHHRTCLVKNAYSLLHLVHPYLYIDTKNAFICASRHQAYIHGCLHTHASTFDAYTRCIDFCTEAAAQHTLHIAHE